MRRKSESILYQLCLQSSLGSSCVLEPAKRRFAILHHRFLLNSRAVLHQHINWLSICNSTDNTFSPFSPDFVDGRKISWTISGAFSGKNIDDKRRAPLLAEWLPPNASFVLKLSEIGLISNHRHCDAAHASTLLCDITSLNLCTITLTHTAPCLLLGDASQPSWICWIKPLWLARSTFSSKLFKPPNLSLLIRRLSAFWTCNLLCRMHQAYSSKEIPSLKPYSSNEISSLNFEPENKPQTAASSMEHFNESSYASIARAHYDHKLIQDF
ncbi:unnamed protein product [Arabidopsis thaliana]|uniref:(thale cress) hypothetical protein n=1 Tax=Arabidopsis thaliana TaxID=3702 RepID=A0A7G2E1N2_ARATH|nr:unnamed protein product [Arabidopsis thaliana]